MTPAASVVVATFDRGPELIGCLRSLLTHEATSPFEVVVVDQTEKQPVEVASALRDLAADPRLRYVRASPASLPGARNLGVELARADVVVFIDDDVVVDEGWLDGHLEAHRAGAQPAGVAGRTRTPGRPPSSELFRIDRWGRNIGGFDYPHPAAVPTARGCNMSFKRAWLVRVGGFDTRFTGNAYREETDLCLRLRRAGGQIRFEPRASLLHLEGDEGGCRERSAIHDRPLAYQNEVLFLLKNWPIAAIPVLLAVNLVSYVLNRHIYRARIVRLRLRAWLQGVPAGVRAYRNEQRLRTRIVTDGLP